MATEMTLPQYYQAVDPRGDSIAMAIYGVVVDINDDDETYSVEFDSGILDRRIRIVHQPICLDYEVHRGGSTCQKCGRQVKVDPFFGKENPNANFCLGFNECLQKFAPYQTAPAAGPHEGCAEFADDRDLDHILSIGDLVRVEIDRESARRALAS